MEKKFSKQFVDPIEDIFNNIDKEKNNLLQRVQTAEREKENADCEIARLKSLLEDSENESKQRFTINDDKDENYLEKIKLQKDLVKKETRIHYSKLKIMYSVKLCIHIIRHHFVVLIRSIVARKIIHRHQK